MNRKKPFLTHPPSPYFFMTKTKKKTETETKTGTKTKTMAVNCKKPPLTHPHPHSWLESVILPKWNCRKVKVNPGNPPHSWSENGIFFKVLSVVEP